MLALFPSLCLRFLEAFAVVVVAAGGAPLTPSIATAEVPLRLGVDVLLAEETARIAGKRVGLLTHTAATDATWTSTLDRMVAAQKTGGFRVTQLFGPEHGVRGFLSPAEDKGPGIDGRTGLPVENLFGFGEKGRPSAASLRRVDVIVVDLQDIGSRTYTYITTLGEVMTAAGKAKIPVIVLDRPNPYGGTRFEGPVLERRYRNFIGWSRMPVTHGMTVGEVARFYREHEGVECELTVIPMRGWRRGMHWRETGLPWTPTSPAIPRPENAWLYAATGMLGGIAENLSEGVGTPNPFEFIGAEWLDPERLLAHLQEQSLPGVIFRAANYRPASFRFKSKVMFGVQLAVTDPVAFRPIRTALALLHAIEAIHPGVLDLRNAGRVARTWGNDRVLAQIRAGRTPAEIEASWAEELAAFAEKRRSVLLYPEP
jgi:uncharacterized protein YbbC (DUF1343 family)